VVVSPPPVPKSKINVYVPLKVFHNNDGLTPAAALSALAQINLSTPVAKLPNFTHVDKVNFCWLPVAVGVLFKYALALPLNLKELFRLFVNGVKAPVEVNVWIVLPPDDVTRPPLNTCDPAYEMITIPEPPD